MAPKYRIICDLPIIHQMNKAHKGEEILTKDRIPGMELQRLERRGATLDQKC